MTPFSTALVFCTCFGPQIIAVDLEAPVLVNITAVNVAGLSRAGGGSFLQPDPMTFRGPRLG